MTNDRGPLAESIDRLAYQCLLQTGQPATHILLPKKSPSEIKAFVRALCDEIEGIGSEPEVFARFMDGQTAQFRDLTIALYDGSQLIVGGERHLQ
jgi:hypothetical protein